MFEHFKTDGIVRNLKTRYIYSLIGIHFYDILYNKINNFWFIILISVNLFNV